MKHPKLKILAVSSLLLIATTTGFSLLHKDSISALDNNFSNGITVDSTLDTPDANIGDTICDDGAGHCTLRAAIQEANANPDNSTILFNITGTPDFTNNSQNGYTIAPQSALPNITEQVTINGYSQPGAQANTAPAPQPLNGTLLIELDGSGAGSGASGLNLVSDNSRLLGLVVNSFSGTGVSFSASNSSIEGSYIGTDPTGLLDKGNTGNGIGRAGTTMQHDTVGGVNPGQRNIVSGNGEAGINSNTGSSDWVVKGNYVGLGADGLTPIPNSYVNGPGGLSLDNTDGIIVGGSEPGAVNVISGNGAFGLFPDNTEDLVIQGNIIGPDWKGDPIPSSHQLGGIGFPPINGPFINTLVGGTNAGEGNLIAHNKGTGISLVSIYFGPTHVGDPNSISILGNKIFNNDTNSSYVLSESGLGIDLVSADMMTATLTSSGPTPNDPTDSDTGPNNYINFPILNSVTQDGTNATINFNLDAADSPTNQYRIEFFANDQADPSGYGEGQTFLGYTTVSNGTNQLANLTLPSGLNLSNKSISATTTAIDNTTNSGFGSTSEFSPIVLASVTNPPTNPPTNSNQSTNTNTNLASTGSNTTAYALLAASLLLVSTILLVRNRSSF